MSSEVVTEAKNEEATQPIVNDIIKATNEDPEQPTEQNKEEATITTPIEQTKEEKTKPIPKAKAKLKAQPKARTAKVVEFVECEACNKKMLPKSLKHTHPYHCKGQPTETLPVNKQKASCGSKVEQQLRKEIEEEMGKKMKLTMKLLKIPSLLK